MLAWYVIVFLLLAGALGIVQAPALAWLAGLALWVAAGPLTGITNTLAAAILAVVFVLPALIFAIRPLCAALISARLLALFRKILPEMSDTERDAIEADTV